MAEAVIQVENLTKRYGRVTAVDDLSFSVQPHEIVGFLGPNGAGKTTTLRILSCFLPATGGTVTIAGLDVLRDSLAIRERIGYLPEHVPLYHDLRVREYLDYRGRLKGLHGRRLRERIEEVAACCGIGDVLRTIVAHLSRGYQKRVGLADSLLSDPDVLILDEPGIGLDPNQIRNLRALIHELAKRHTILLSSHILPEVEMLCERVFIIDKGRIVASDTPANLVGLVHGSQQVVAEIQGPCEEVVAALGGVRGVRSVKCEGLEGWNRLTCECDYETDVREALFREVAAHAWGLRHLAAVKRNLEDVFVALTATQPHPAAPASGETTP